MTPRRRDLLAQLEQVLRKVGAQSVLMSETVGRLVGLNATDLKCLDLLHLSEPMTAGRLAEHTGLTTGAITAVIDRLERAGFVRRMRDPHDRRRVLVTTLQRGNQCIMPLYTRLAARVAALNAGYTDRQLTTVADYLSCAIDLAAEHVAWLQTQPLARGGRAARRPARRPRGRRVSRPVPDASRRAAALGDIRPAERGHARSGSLRNG